MSYLQRFPLASDVCWCVEHAAGEALANVVRHADRDGSYFEIRARFVRSVLRIEVENDSPSTVKRATWQERAFGISVMRSLVDAVAFFKDGHMVRLEKRIAVGAADDLKEIG